MLVTCLSCLSRHEPFGIVVLEAWSAGKPVAVSQVGGLQDLVSDDLDGVCFRSADSAGCAVCLRKLLRKPELRERLGRAGKRKARKVYSWRRIAQETEPSIDSPKTMPPRGMARHE